MALPEPVERIPLPPEMGDPACPVCQAVGSLVLERRERLSLRKVGTWSLAGVQPKTTGIMTTTLWLVCTGCGFEEQGKRD